MIEKLYGGYDRETKLRALREHGASDTQINDFLIPAAHRKEDMIVEYGLLTVMGYFFYKNIYLAVELHIRL